MCCYYWSENYYILKTSVWLVYWVQRVPNLPKKLLINLLENERVNISWCCKTQQSVWKPHLQQQNISQWQDYKMSKIFYTSHHSTLCTVPSYSCAWPTDKTNSKTIFILWKRANRLTQTTFGWITVSGFELQNYDIFSNIEWLLMLL